MSTNLSIPFFEGVSDGGDCFSPGNPYFYSSPCHMAFEAGRHASTFEGLYRIESAFQSLGYSIRLQLKEGGKQIIRIDYKYGTVRVA